MLYDERAGSCRPEGGVACRGVEIAPMLPRVGAEAFSESKLDWDPMEWDPNVIDRGYSKTIIGYVSCLLGVC